MSHWPATFILVPLFLAQSIVDMDDRSRELQKSFPELAARKSALTRVAVVADVAEFEFEKPNQAWLYVDDCRAMGQYLEDTLTAMLAAKGYPAQARPVLGVGFASDTSIVCRVLPSWSSRALKNKDRPRSAPPFYADSTLSGTPELTAAWSQLMHASLWRKKRKRDESLTVTVPPSIREVVGVDYLVVATVLGTKNPKYPRWDEPEAAGGIPSMPTPAGLPKASGVPPPTRGFGFMRAPDESLYPGLALRVSVIECATGNVLWADVVKDVQGLNKNRLDLAVRDIVKQLP